MIAKRPAEITKRPTERPTYRDSLPLELFFLALLLLLVWSLLTLPVNSNPQVSSPTDVLLSGSVNTRIESERSFECSSSSLSFVQEGELPLQLHFGAGLSGTYLLGSGGIPFSVTVGESVYHAQEGNVSLSEGRVSFSAALTNEAGMPLFISGNGRCLSQ